MVLFQYTDSKYLSSLVESDLPFQVNRVSGLIALNNRLTTTIVRYIFRVEVSDNGFYSRKSQVQVEVKVASRNNNSPVFKNQLTECVFPSRGDCTVRLIGLQRETPSFKLKSCANFRISPISGTITVVTNTNKNVTVVCQVCTGSNCAMVSLTTKSVISYPHVFVVEEETIKYIPTSRMIKKVNQNYKLFISALNRDYFISNGYIQIRPGVSLASNYHVKLSVLELSPQPKLFRLNIDRRTRSEISSDRQPVQTTSVELGNAVSYQSVFPIRFNGAGFIEIKSNKIIEVTITYEKNGTSGMLMVLKTDIGLIEIAHLNESISIKSTSLNQQVQIQPRSTYKLTFVFAANFVIKDAQQNWTISRSRVTVFSVLFGYNPFKPIVQPFVGTLNNFLVNSKPVSYLVHELDNGVTSIISGLSRTDQICVDLCASQFSCQSNPFGVQCSVFCKDESGAYQKCSPTRRSTKSTSLWRPVLVSILVALVIVCIYIFRDRMLLSLPRKYAVLSRPATSYKVSHNEQAIISYDPRERSAQLPRIVRFNSSTGQVLQAVTEEDELVLNSHDQSRTSMSDETENELFV